jgi:hypothetical protein
MMNFKDKYFLWLRTSSPWFAYLAFTSFFVFGKSYYRYANNQMPPYWSLWFSDTVISLFFALATYFLHRLWVANKKNGAIEPEKNAHRNRIFVFDEKMEKKVNYYLFSLIGILILIGFLAVGNPFSNPLAFRQSIQGGGAAYFFVSFLFFFKFKGMTYFNKVYLKQSKIADHVVMALVVAFCFTTGFASLFIYFFVGGLLFLNIRYSVRIIRFSTVFVFFALLIFTPLYTIIREQLLVGVADISQIYKLFVENFMDDPLKIVYQRFDYFENQVLGAHFARVNMDPWKIFDALLQPVPRLFYAEKPPNLSTYLTDLTYPELKLIGVSINFGYLSEFVLYFGDFGPVIGGIFFGWILSVSYGYFVRGTKDGNAAVIYVLATFTYFTGFIIGYLNEAPIQMFIMSLILLRILGWNTWGREVANAKVKIA